MNFFSVICNLALLAQSQAQEPRNVIINDGTLDVSMQQLLLTILYAPGSSTQPSQTIIPDLALTSGAIPQSIQDGLTNPQTANQYVDAIAQFSNQFNLKFSLIKGLNNGADTESLDATWEKIVEGAESRPMPAEDLKKYNKLESQLWLPSSTNELTGITSARQKTPLYEAEQTAQLAYYDALSNYYQVKQKTLAEKGGAATWSEIGPIEQQKVDMAMNDWTSSGKDQVALIISQMDNLLTGCAGELITAAAKAFEESTNESKNFGKFHQCLTSPADVFSPTSTAWTSITTCKGQSYSEPYETAIKSGFDGSAQWGLWSVSASGSGEQIMTYQDSETTNTTISLEYARVRLTRPWFMIDWMQANDWTYLDTAPGSISKGTIGNNIDKELIIGAYPTELILARNVKVTAKFAKKVLNALKTANSGSTSVGWGPFKIGGSISGSKFEENTHSQDINGAITIPGPFVVGYILNTLPNSAPH